MISCDHMMTSAYIVLGVLGECHALVQGCSVNEFGGEHSLGAQLGYDTGNHEPGVIGEELPRKKHTVVLVLARSTEEA